MIKKKAPGRPKKKESDKVKVVSAYLTGLEQRAIETKYDNISNALRVVVLPKCG